MTGEKITLDEYCYAGTDVFINKQGIKDRPTFEICEGAHTTHRILELCNKPISGDHSLKHWQKIHRHIFQDVYPWAGELRKTPIFDDVQSPYADPQKIEAGYKNLILPILDSTSHLKLSDSPRMAQDMAKLMGELYYIHPFRDGNTRSLIQFTKAIAQDAGIALSLERLTLEQWKDLQYGIVQAAHAQSPALLESILEKCTTRMMPCVEISRGEVAQAQEIQREQKSLMEATSQYDRSLSDYIQAKTAQCERLEAALERHVAAQQSRVAHCQQRKPGVVSSLWRGQEWNKEMTQEQSRLASLERRLGRVQGIKADARKLERMAEAKLRRENEDLTRRRDAQLKSEREKVLLAQAHTQSQGIHQKCSRGRTQKVNPR